MNTNQKQPMPDLTPLMEHTPHSNEEPVIASHHSPKRSKFLFASGALLFLFLFVSLGILLYQNQQNQSTDLRSRAAEFGDLNKLMESTNTDRPSAQNPNDNKETPPSETNNPDQQIQDTLESCQNITFLKDGQAVTKTAIRPGDTVDIVVPKSQYSKAEFIVDSVSNSVEPSSSAPNEFRFRYTFPANATTISVRVNLLQ